MSADSRDDPAFHITHETETGESLLVGLSAFGLAGLTAVDYLTDQLGLEPTGHITAEALPSITRSRTAARATTPGSTRDPTST